MALIRNLARIRELVVDKVNFGQLIQEAFLDVQKQLGNASAQTNASLSSNQNVPPPQINAVNVTASGGVAHIQVTDNNQNIYRGITYHYHVAPASSPSSFVTLYSGPNRDARLNVGSSPLVYAVTSDYPTSPHSPPVYFGGSQPTIVAAAGTEQPPMPSGQGSGTGTPGQISGFGPIPYRGSIPPRRA